ncbi:unnamed protein product [Malus baccata var. baccata]
MPADENMSPNPSLFGMLDKVTGSLPSREDELAKAIRKKIPRKNMTESKPVKNTSSSKKTCICAPTEHASFRCHIHQTSLAKLSRFGRAASAKTCHGNLLSQWLSK